ncbi:type II toxin-antitoxin system HigB family toxin [Chamaesiphon sp. VAR_48_metabat_403]|uniref:type II toxin-antitoxin system HigB family toxin n=1 Tax=Chamaesiphon sp. VAR_48_metabat_403 TaxID=2964700 RepID=UPI00286DE011|nr:type II toxin-antitoxin system HigB family toxin [Chamaesiphon sp. VAR_48_metabat_403]
MEIIGLSELIASDLKHADVQKAVNTWIAVVQFAQWQSLIDIKNTYSRSADYVNDRTVFNLRGNNYRLIVVIDYELQIVVFEALLTHAEYDRYSFD